MRIESKEIGRIYITKSVRKLSGDVNERPGLIMATRTRHEMEI
jgi:hypothetical protein